MASALAERALRSEPGIVAERLVPSRDEDPVTQISPRGLEILRILNDLFDGRGVEAAVDMEDG
jgi:hypothetical protein